MSNAIALACGLAREFEGCSLTVYRDPVGIPTIGYGSTRLLDGSPVTMFTPPISQDEADGLLSAVMTEVAEAVDRLVRVPANDNMRGALADFAYNLGVTALADSTLLRLMNDKYYDAAALQFGRWVHAGARVLPGLVKRRAAEAELFRQGRLV